VSSENKALIQRWFDEVWTRGSVPSIDALMAPSCMVHGLGSGTGTHRGNGLGFSATNRPIRFSGMTFARIQDGKLVEGWNVFDQLGMLQQLGIVNLPA